MSFISWRYRDSSGQPQGQTFYFEFDAVTAEEFTRSAEVTDYPIESGGVLSDHYQILPYNVSVHGVVSDTPVKVTPPREGLSNAAPSAQVSGYPTVTLPGATTARRSEGVSIIKPVVSLPSARLVRANIERARIETPIQAKVLHFNQPMTRVSDVFKLIDKLMETKTPVDVVAFEDVEFKDMMIINHRAPRISGSGGSIEFVIDLRQVRAANAAVTRAPQQRKEVKHKPKTDTGKKNPTPVEPSSKQASDITSVYRNSIQQVPDGYTYIQ